MGTWCAWCGVFRISCGAGLRLLGCIFFLLSVLSCVRRKLDCEERLASGGVWVTLYTVKDNGYRDWHGALTRWGVGPACACACPLRVRPVGVKHVWV